MQNLRSLWNVEVSVKLQSTWSRWSRVFTFVYVTVWEALIRECAFCVFFSILYCRVITQNKGNLTHISWAWSKTCWEILMREQTFSRYVLVVCLSWHSKGECWTLYYCEFFVLCPTPVCSVTDIWHLWIYLGSRMFSQEILGPHMTKQSRHWCGCFCPDLRSFFLPKLCNR